MISTLLFLSVVALQAAPPTAQDSVLVRYDLSATMPTFDGGGFEETMLLSGGNAHIEYVRTDFEEMFESNTPDVVVELLTRLLSEEFEYEGREIHLQDEDELLVMAPQALQDKVRATLATIERAFSASAEIQVDVLTLPGDGPAPFGGANVVDVSQLASLPGGGQGTERETYAMRVYAGRTSVLEMMREIPLLFDFDIEIAQGAIMHDPIMGVAEVGTRLYLRGAPVAGGLGLSVYYTRGDALTDGPVRKEIELNSMVSRDSSESVTIDAPGVQEEIDVLVRSVAFNTTLSEGKALVFSSLADIAGTKSRQVVILRQTGGGLERFYDHTPAGSGRRLFLINAEALHVPEVSSYGRLRDDRSEYTNHIPTLVAQLKAEPSLFLYDWVANKFSTWRTMGPWLLCVFDPSWDGDASTQLQALLGGWKEDARLVQCAVSVHSRGHGGPVPASWSLPLRPGSSCAAMIGISSTQLSDYDVEVAQTSAGADPRHEPMFNGAVFRLKPSFGSSGVLGLDVDAAAYLRRGAVRKLDLGGPLITTMEASNYDHMRVVDRVTATGGGRSNFVLGGQSAGGEGGGMQLRIEVR